jgi:hypothetical protein
MDEIACPPVTGAAVSDRASTCTCTRNPQSAARSLHLVWMRKSGADRMFEARPRHRYPYPHRKCISD